MTLFPASSPRRPPRLRRRGACFFASAVGFLAFNVLAFGSKATAPFDVDAHFSGNHVAVSVKALADARDVVVSISGSDGLVVLGGAAQGTVQVKEFRQPHASAGETFTFEADFTATGERSMLAVSVECAGEPALVRGFSPPSVPRQASPSAGIAVAHSSGTGKVGWPIHLDATFDPASGHAHVAVTTTRAGTDLVVKVYGLDGLIVSGGVPEGALIVHTERKASLQPGETFAFEVGVQPGAGQSYLVVFAQGRGIGSDQCTLPLGQLSDAQKRERQQGVTVDPEGHPIKIMNR